MAQAVVQYFNTAGSNNIYFPSDVSAVAVEGIGGGGAGAYRNATGNGGGGSGAGYAKLNAFSPVAGTTYALTVGVGGNTQNNANGTNTTFNTSSLIAKGGVTAGRNNATGQNPQTAQTGDVLHDGGTGASGALSVGGGGGSSGGNAANGNAGSGATGGTAPAGGGAGGAGAGTSNSNGTSGSFPGGGGGGSTRTAGNHLGGNGATGQLIFSFTSSVPILTTYGAVEPTNTNQITQSITIDYANSTLVCGPSAYDATGTDTVITSITYNGVAMDLLESSVFGGGGGDGSSNYLYAKTGLSAGTANLVVTYTGSCSNPTVHWAVLANTASSIDNSDIVTNGSAGNPQTASLTTIADNCIVWSWIGFGANGGGSASGSDQFTTGNTETGFVVSSISKTAKTPAGSVTHTYTNGTSDTSTVFLASIAPYVAAGGTTIPGYYGPGGWF